MITKVFAARDTRVARVSLPITDALFMIFLLYGNLYLGAAARVLVSPQVATAPDQAFPALVTFVSNLAGTPWLGAIAITGVVSAAILHRYMVDRFPQLRGIKITHSWTGNTAFTLDALPHMGSRDNLHYCLGCNGSGIAMMTYLGWQTARKIAGAANARCAFDRDDFPDHALYSGNPWFLPEFIQWANLSIQCFGVRSRNYY